MVISVSYSMKEDKLEVLPIVNSFFIGFTSERLCGARGLNETERELLLSSLV